MMSARVDGLELRKLETFQRVKNTSLSKKDLSLKGSIDELIRPLVDMINNSKYYYTTSTCSGRVTLIEKPIDKPGIKKGSKFVYNTHEEIDPDTFNLLLETYTQKNDEETSLWLKFEPFILHIQCFNLDKAKILLNIALEVGCRNSGITTGKDDKFMVAIRSTSSMEVPIHCGSRFLLGMDYTDFLREECGRRLVENKCRLYKLQDVIKNNHLWQNQV